MARSVKREHEAVLATRRGVREERALRVARIVENTRNEGPGERFALWVQGCTLRCQHCCNPEMWPLDAGRRMRLSEVISRLERASRSGIEGITLDGGEPFLQADALVAVARRAKTLDLGVITFTGFELDALLDDHDDNVRRLLEVTDLLIDGPYDHSTSSTEGSWVGSDNQRLHFFTDRYRDRLESDEDDVQGALVGFESEHLVVTGLSASRDLHVRQEPERKE